MRIGSVRRVVTLSLISVFFSLTFIVQSASAMPKVPDREKTPGNLCDVKDPDYAGNRYKAKIPYCERNVSSELKVVIYEQYGIPANERKNYTIDHFIPLSIGGNNGPENLWPEHRKIKETRINFETEIFEAVRDGSLTQKEAIERVEYEKMHPNL